ncbi:SPRY_domain/HECT-domain_(ubiquitin-transferase)_-_putative [Leishmania infantum]|uniref:SPRY_domain/HECT-domain_(Ubiquitin-transferase)_-_putative n=1 Tax=Leishmania infantum TaxID=5671 RepID=A0A6L0WNL6_LEIIN|nr:SPRY_domain/HECT-domain_(ubiquitin-transferase)_-_putative [Leishmania infantum]SUZ40200.1 SPRY_domain/HECT-domain_(ubiquitin-transferase)_-_putative [Leishmania infantum]
MDQLSSLYVRMASGAHSQIHNPSSVMGFVDQMQSRMEKSSAPRKNYLIDSSTPHSDTVIAESSALKPSVGWVTLQVTEGIRRGIHEWGIKIEHHGESNDGSGLMLGIVPKNFTKYDTFISQGGGWCLSRAGKFYGHWRRTDSGGGVLTFGTGDRVVLTLDYDAAVMTVRVGDKTVVGELSGLTMEVFPAISLHYRHQHVRFDHHAVRETAEQHLPWLQRQAFPFAPAFLPLSFSEVQRLPLNSYLFSNLFQHHTSLEWSSAMADTAGGGDAGHPAISAPDASGKKRNAAASLASSPDALAAARLAEQRAMRLYTSSEAAAARLTVLSRAFAAVRRYAAVVPGKSRFLAPHVTAEYLRQRLYSAAREPSLGSGGGSALTTSGGLSSSGASAFRFADSAGYDATLNCGAVIVVHLFVRAVSSGQEVAVSLVHSFRDYLLSLPIFSLVEYDGCASGNGCSGGGGGARGSPFSGGNHGGVGGARSALAPDTVQLAVDHIVRLVESALKVAEAAPTTAAPNSNGISSGSSAGKRKDGGGDGPAVTPLTSALLEVAVVLALQRGLVSEVLRVSRYLLRVPSGIFSPPLVHWLNRHAAGLTPQQALPDVGRALKRACEDPSAFIATPVDPVTRVLSVAYGIGATLFVHTADGLTKYGPSAATPYVLVVETRQPTAYCVGAASSSLAVTHTRVLLLTDLMASAEVALVVYGLQLDTHQVLRWADMHGSWPCTLNAHPQLVSTTEDRVLVVYEDHQQQAPSARVLNGAAAAAGTPASAAANGGVVRSTAGQSLSAAAATATSAEWTVMMHCYNAATASSLTAAPLWARALHPAAAPAGLCLNRCLALRKPSLVDLGSPEEHLTVAGGQVTVELWVQFLDKEDAATLYQHGDRSTSGEVFIELIKSEGAYCIRGGYRHEMRGSCLVSAPLPPTAESRPFHIGLVFNGRWRLLFDGEEVAGNRQGPHVSLDSPKQRWTVGANCTCLLTGLRVWRLGRTAREISRDYRRSLVGDEPGLVVQLFFNEKSGNVVFNYVHNVKACHAVCIGAVAHKACDTHPWRSYGSGALGGSSAAAASVSAASTVTASGAAAPAAASSPDVTPVCARLHEWRNLTISTCCATRHALIVRTPISDDGPYALREGGHVLMFFDLAAGVAHHSLFFLTSRSPVRHMMRADPQGRLWELFEVDVGLVKGEQEASYLLSLLGNPGAAPQRPRDRVLAVAPLPLMEDEEGLDNLSTLANEGGDEDGDGAEEGEPRDSLGSTTTSEINPVGMDRNTADSQRSSEAAASQATQTLSRLSSFTALVAQPSSVVTYGTVALWLLKLLALHAEAEPGVDQTLFSPLADDVGSRCVTEVRLILGEHFRVVKSNNARRAVALKSSVSWVVVAAALRVLLRLVRRARAFGLHPTPLGLTVVREGTERDGGDAADESQSSPTHVSKATMTLLLRELHASSLRRRASASVVRSRRSAIGHPGSSSADDGDGFSTDSFTLLGLLGDIINEDGLTLSPDVVTLARIITIEGVELFLPDVRHRAHLLRDLLRASSGASSPRASTAAGGAAVASPPSVTAEERVPAMEVLLDAVAQSFTTVLAAAPLLGVDDDSAGPGSAASLTELCGTLRTLLEESSVQWQRLWDASTAIRSVRKFASFATSLSEAIASLQLLLLSACQGSRWEVALTLMYASGGGSAANRVADATRVRDGGGQGDSSNSGNGATANGVAGSGVGGVNGGGAGVGGPDSVAAAALDLQRLCFSQAAAYHPCVRAYYSALFDGTEVCLSLCVQQPAQQPSTGSTSKTAERGGGDSGAPLSAMLSSLAPTFVNAPLHTALSAIPLVLAAEDAEWFLKRLEHLLMLCETLLERVELLTRPNSGTDIFTSTTNASSPVLPGSGSAISARRLVCSLREALFYASVWVAAFLFNSTAVSSASVKADAVRRRLGLLSVTTTPTTQRQTAQLTGHAPSVATATSSTTGAPPSSSTADDAAYTAVGEELARVWEHPLLEGGLWPGTVSIAAAAPQHRAQFVSQLIKNTAYWTAKQTMLDPLASKSHPAMGPLITAMAAAALHLSAVPLQHLPPTQVEEFMCAVMRKLSRPIRTELLSRREEGEDDGSSGPPSPSSSSPPSLSRPESLRQTLTELQRRCEVLLQARTCTELWAVEDALFCIPTERVAAGRSLGSGRAAWTYPPLLPGASAPSSSAPMAPSALGALHSAWSSYQLRRMRFRAHAASHPSWTLQEATQLVTSVVLSRQITAELLRAALQQREELAALRRTGIEHIFRLVQRAPHSAESAAQLLSAQGRGAHTHYEEGIGGCGSAHVDHIRRTLFDLLRWSMEEMPTQLGASGSATRDGGSAPLSMTSTATVLCGLLDRSWRPRDFAFFVQLRVVPTMMETYVTLFVPVKRADDEEAAEVTSGMRSSGDTFGLRRPSTVAVAMTASNSSASPTDDGATATDSRAGSVEMRHVNLAERQNRDKVIAAQQARRTSKSALMTAFTLNRAGGTGGGGGGPHGSAGLMSGGTGDAALQHTAVEAMQAKVWQCFKSLALQSTAMLTPERIASLSRVEQTSVMTFLADMLGAMETELRLCRDMLSRAVKDTPTLLAQASDAAVLEPLVTVQDQVDLLLSFLSVVSGTLCSASLSVSVSAPVGHTTAGRAPNARNTSGDCSLSARDGTALFLSCTLSTMCATIAETLLELVFLDMYHARAVSADAGVGCVVRDAAACARVAALLLCRCQPSAVRGITVAPGVWQEMYESPAFAKMSLPASSPLNGGHPCMQRWLDLSVYALATTGMSRTTQHVLLAFRRLLHQPAWAAELRGFASSYQDVVHAYAASVLSSRSGGGEMVGAAGKPTLTGADDGAAGTSSNFSTNTPARGREVHAVHLYVWSAILGGQLLVPPTSPGASVTFLDEKDGYQAVTACVVDVEAMAPTSVGPGGMPTKAGTPSSAQCGRPIRGSSHFLLRTAATAAEGEKLRGVVVVPTDATGHSGNRGEVQLSPNQLFLPAWENAIVVPSYAGLVEDFLAPALRLCVPLLNEKLDTAAGFTGFELTYFITLFHLTAGVARARPDLGRQLIQCGAMKPIRQYALQGVVRLPFPLKALREFGALVAVRAAEATADRICAPPDNTDNAGGLASSVAGAAATGGAGAPSLAAALAAVSATEISRASAGSRSPFGSPVSTQHQTLPGVSEALLESLRSVSPGPSVGYPATFLSGFPQSSATAASSSGFLRDSNEYGLSRLARSLGVFGGAYGGAAISGAPSQQPMRTTCASVANILRGGSSLTTTTARIPPRTEVGSGAPMFLSFPMWPAHDVPPCGAARSGVAGQPSVPAAVEITPSRAGVHFPVWEDGFAIELAVLLSDGDMYPAMGDALSVPCSWPKPQLAAAGGNTALEFPLLTLYTSADGGSSGAVAAASSDAGLFPFLQLSVQESSLNVVVRLPPSTVGAPDGKEALRCSARRTLRREDWYHCMHVSVMCNAQSLALSRNGEMTSVEWGGAAGVGRCAEALLRREGAIRKVVLGRAETGMSSAPPREVDGPMALIGGLRLWSTSVLRTSLRVVAELVARDRALQSIGLHENVCYLDLKEGTGAVVESADSQKQFRGVLSGSVRWAAEPLPLGFYPSIELNSGGVLDGVTAPLASSIRVPRVAMAAFVDSLSSFYYERFGGDVLWSLLTLAARYATVTALEVGTSPAYALHCLADTSVTSSASAIAARSAMAFDPRQVLDPAQKVPHQLNRLFQLHDSGYLPNAHERLIHAVVQRLVAVLAAAVPEEEEKTDKSSVVARVVGGSGATAAPAASQLCGLVADTAYVLRQLRRDDGEIFVIEVPPPGQAASASAAITQPVVLPLAFTNGGAGVLTFDAKYRNMEQATVYKDVELKSVIAKYPDGQGGWPLCTLTATETPWAFLRSVPTSTSHRLAADGKPCSPGSMPSSSIVTVTTKSLKPAILHAMVKAVCDALRSLAGASGQGHRRGNGSAGSSIAERAAACLLDARVVVSLIQQSSARSSEDDCVHFVHILTAMMRLWRDMPEVQPYDQVPLAMAMSHLNTPLCSIIQHVSSDSDIGSFVSLSTGTYSPYVQSLLGLLVSAVHADCAWTGRSYVEQLQGRWRRLWGMWQRAVVYRPSQLADAKRRRHKSAACAGSTGKGVQTALPNGGRRDGAAEEGATATTAGSSAFRALFLAPHSSSSNRYQLQGATPNMEMPHVDSLDASVAIAGSSTTGHGTTESPEPEPSDGSHAGEEGPLNGGSSASTAAASSGDRSQAPPLVVELVSMQPASTGPAGIRSSSPFSSATESHDQHPQPTQKYPRRPYPSGVSRKGNGLWVVRATCAGKEHGEEQNPFAARDGAARSVTTVRSTVGLTTGMFYWEVYVANISRAEHTAATLAGGNKLPSNILVGVATERCVPTHSSSSATGSGAHAEGRDGFLGSDGESWGFDGGRAMRLCRGYAVESSPRTRWKMDDVIGFVLDLRQNKLCCLHNGRLVSEFSDTFLSEEQRAARVAVFPVITCTGEASCEVNFGATGFASTPPPGCLPVDLSIYINEEACRVWKVVLADEVSAPLASATVAAATRAGQPARLLLPSPVIPLVGQHLTRFTQGRQGPLDVVLLSSDSNAKLVTSRECKTDDAASLLFGSVAVTSGRWYFEVVLPTEPTFSVGWHACKSLEEQGSGGRGGAGLAGLIGSAGGGAPGGSASNRDAAIASPTSPSRVQLWGDGPSWVFDAGRMIARHNKHQVSLARRVWKCGDVVGCLLDCEAGTVSFSVNGEFLKAAHGSGAVGGGGRGGGNVAGLSGTRGNSEPFEATAAASATSTQDATATALFRDVCMSETHGLVPAILLEPKSSLVCLWNEEELLFPPTNGGDFRALGGASAVHDALVEMIVVPDGEAAARFRMHPLHDRGDAARQPRKEERLYKPVDAVALQKLLYYASKVQELHPTSLRSYTMPSLYGVHGAAQSLENPNASVAPPRDLDVNAVTPSRAVSQRHQQRDLCTASGLDAATLQPHLMALLLFGHLSTLLYPFAHPAALPVTVENAPLGSSWAFSELQETLRACQRYAPPWASLRALQWSLDASNGAGNAVRLSVNRRKALTVVRDSTASAVRRLRDSLFGQVYQLLASKPPEFFITSKKLWTVSFYGEGADDVGGPYRECLTQMSAELMSTSLALFLPSANMASELGEVRDSYVVNPLCAPPLELHMYRFIGRLMGGCLRGGEPLSLYLSSALWKYLVGEAADDTDMARIDMATLNALGYVEQLAGFPSPRGALGGSGDGDDAVRDEELAELCPRGFSLLNDAGVVEELVPGGEQIPVTVASADLYTRLVREHKLYRTGAAQLRALQQGFHEVVPLCSVSGLKWYELEELVCGQCDYDPDALLDAARYEGLSPTDVRVRFLRSVLRGFTRHQRALFMRFVSGRERLPPGMHLKIMPDDAPRVAPIPPITPDRAAPSLQSASPHRRQRVVTSPSHDTTTAVMTPQPPPSSEQRCGTSFVRHNTLAQSRPSSNTGSNTLPPSPPQLGFTPPPPQAVSRMVPPPALQPGQLQPVRGSGSGGQSHAPASLLSPLGMQERCRQQESKGGDGMVEDGVDFSLCDDTRLPQASTCFYWLRLPCYSSTSVMAQKLLFAIEQCVDIDADFRVHDTDVAQQEVGPSLARVSSDEDDLFEDFSHLR